MQGVHDTLKTSRKPKLAYLITAHVDPESLAALASTLIAYDPHALVYIHVDKKVELAPFTEAVPEHERIQFLPERIAVSWGGFSFLEAQVSLLRHALIDADSRADRFIFLSGLDFPLIRPDRIRKAFEANPDLEFIGGSNLTDSGVKAALWRIDRYHLFLDSRLPGPIQKLASKLTLAIFRVLRIKKSTYAPMGPNLVPVYTGSDWFALTERFACFALKQFDKDPALRAYFRHTFVPSELFWHTVCYNSNFQPVAGRFKWNTTDVSDLLGLAPLHHFTYDKQVGGLTEADLPDLLKSGKLFGRKFFTGKSDQLRRNLIARWESNPESNLVE